jgi:DNA-directed RNA polymerase subunit H (RpoH/RPB5)
MEQTSEIIKSFHTIVDMMRDRRLHSDVSELEDFRDQQLAVIAATPKAIFSLDFPSCQLRVIYNINMKFKVVDVKKLLTSFSGTIILVARDRPGTLALKGIEDAASAAGGVHQGGIQVFDIKELQFNVARHSLVPQHEPLRDEAEIARILKALSVRSKFQLPLIHNTDAMARYLALKPGELVRIRRLSPSAGEYISYRCCIKVG